MHNRKLLFLPIKQLIMETEFDRRNKNKVLPFLFFIVFLKTYGLFIKKYNHFPVLKGLFLLFLAGIMLFFFWIMRSKIQLPIDMIPTKWSDFSFWQRYFEAQKNSLYVFFAEEKTPFQIEDLKRAGKVVGDMFIALFCLWENVHLKKVQERSDKHINLLTK